MLGDLHLDVLPDFVLIDVDDRVEEEGEQGHGVLPQFIAGVDRPPIQRQSFEDPVEHMLALSEEVGLTEALVYIFVLAGFLHLDHERE